MNKQLKKLFYDIANVIDNWMENYKGMPPTNGYFAKVDLLKFLMYLSASDGSIDLSEVREMDDVMGMDSTLQETKEIIEENDIYSEIFESTVPPSYLAAIEMDNFGFETGQLSSDQSCASALLSIYKKTGIALIHADNDVNPTEISDYHIYINMLENYIKGNDKLVSNNMDKETSDISEEKPINHGVAAPKKR